MARRVPARMRRSGLPVAVGQGLVAVIGLLLVLTAPLVGFTWQMWRTLAIVSAVMTVVLIVSSWLPWSRRRSPAVLMGFPIVGLGALTVLGLSTAGIAFAYVGVIPLCFLYVGMFLRPTAGALLLPVAWVSYIAMVGTIDANLLVRLAIYSVGWVATSYTLALLVSRQRAITRALMTENFTDALTMVGNRRSLDLRLSQLATGDCVAICDLDLFKSINDAFGHAAGDEVLRQFGSMLNQHLRRRDFAGRYGGEEFVLVFVRTEPAQAVAALASLREEWLDLSLGVTFSAGIAQVSLGLPAQDVLAHADAALFEAKAAGRDCFRIATPTLHA
ncbi:MAG: diguanylate cyclase [Cellulomonas sp.]